MFRNFMINIKKLLYTNRNKFINQIRVPLFFSQSFSDLQIAAVGERRTMIIFAKLYRFKYIFFVIKYRK